MRARAEKPRGNWGSFNARSRALRARISRFPGFAAGAPRSTKPPSYAGYRYINTEILEVFVMYSIVEGKRGR